MSETKILQKVIVIGDTQCGKTSIISRFLHDTFHDDVQITIGVDFLSKKVQIYETTINLQVWDTAGAARFKSIISNLFRSTDTNAFVLVLDATKSIKEQGTSIKDFIINIKGNVGVNVPIYVAINKIDLNEQIHSDFQNGNKHPIQQVFSANDTILQDEHIFFCSAKTGDNIVELFSKIVQDFAKKLFDLDSTSSVPSTQTTINPTPLKFPFLKNLLIHPGTWVLGSLVLLGMGIFFPPAAPALAAVAVGGLIVGGLTCFPYIGRFFDMLNEHEEDIIPYFLTKHPFQATVLVLTLLAFIAALVLTIGFFTGGAGFAFMAPLLAVSGGSLFGPALLGFATVMAPLTIGNNLKRFLGWLDSFTRDGAAEIAKQEKVGDEPELNQPDNRPFLFTQWKKEERINYTEQLIQNNPIRYLQLFGHGVKATVLPGHDKGWFTSPDAELIEKCKVKRA